MNPAHFRRIALAVSAVALLMAAMAPAFAASGGSSPAVECAPHGSWWKIEINDGAVGAVESNLDSGAVSASFTPWTLSYTVNTDRPLLRVVLKYATNTNSLTPSPSGTISLPTNISHVTFCFGEVPASTTSTSLPPTTTTVPETTTTVPETTTTVPETTTTVPETTTTVPETTTTIPETTTTVPETTTTLPETTTTTGGTGAKQVTTTTVVTASTLPFTGGNGPGLLSAAAVLLTSGGALLVATRRRDNGEDPLTPWISGGKS